MIDKNIAKNYLGKPYVKPPVGFSDMEDFTGVIEGLATLCKEKGLTVAQAQECLEACKYYVLWQKLD